MNRFRLKSVSFRHHWLLDGVSFELKNCLLILGPALSGKTMLACALGDVSASLCGSRSDAYYELDVCVDVFREGEGLSERKWTIIPGKHMAEWPSIGEICETQAIDWLKGWRAVDPSSDSAHDDRMWTLRHIVKPGGWDKERFEYVHGYARAFFRYVQCDDRGFQRWWEADDWWDAPDSYKHWLSLLTYLADPGNTLLVLDNAFGRMDVRLCDLVFEAIVSAAAGFEKRVIMLTHDPYWAYCWLKRFSPPSTGPLPFPRSSRRGGNQKKGKAEGGTKVPMLFMVRDYDADRVRMISVHRDIVLNPKKLFEDWLMDMPYWSC